MRTPSRMERIRRARERARDAFLRAAAALNEFTERDALAFALLEAAIGIAAIIEADDDDAAFDKVIARLRHEQDRRPSVPPEGATP